MSIRKKKPSSPGVRFQTISGFDEITKAEPELLDELGIILRLADAQEEYKLKLGITGRELTKFEKSQAVAVDTLTQVEEKYSKR